ncbi:Muniscin C-terminal mu homology domain-containing protein [Aspergillus caelatus]|uniref:Muniscin C-terminal mu homology domain-containing protein n=1 Tax=Aspergillus caelatus TaxID=61420 RepID=A0A5N7A8F1_9EURO|nr:FCH domain-containing muniscin-like protein [Aspergillus caelatus]KAE8366102.1 Muniscin C-terminal mu homology domain-containing protein [Aspergillus caelatus]
MMDLSRQEYPALLASLQPGQATGVLNDRIRLINKINADIADWLQERRRVEEAYAQGLRKLATRQQLDNGAALGIFQIPWQRIVNATEMVASSHETFAQKIEEDVERPLRDYHTKNRELASLPGVQSDLATLAKNLEASLKKVEKAREKGPKGADKLAGAVAASEGVRQEWESRAPFAFEQLQAADESRLNHLRDALTQLETHESDQVERCRQAAETCLNVLLNVETADEIKTFAEKVNGGRPVILRQQTSPTPAAAPSGPPPRLHDDTASQRSETSGPVRTPPAPEPQPRHSTPLGGLKRLGTVMNRRKSIIQPSGGAAFFSDKKHRSPFASFKRGDSRDMQIPESLPDEERPGTALTTQENHNEATRIPSETNDHEGHGTMASIPAAQSVPTTANGTTAPEPPAETGFAISDSNQPRVDSEGFSEPPQTIDEITRAQREAAGMEEAGINLTIRDQPIFEDEDQAKQAMDDMANQLRLRAQQSGVRRNVGTLRGRRDVRNTVFIPNPPQGSDVPTLPSGSDVSMPVSPGLPSKHAASPSIATEDHALSDTTSVRSGHTLHGSSGAVAHPDLHEPGLNASIIETVNAWLSDGVVTKSSVIGELALAYNGTPEANTTVRLENFQVLEKVAANPHFVNEEKDKDLSDEKRGQYSIHIPTIARPSPTVAFKYQLHVDPSDSSAYCPVIFKPVWNIEEHQASVIIFYSLNPSFTSSSPRESITLKNLVLTVNLDTSPEEGREVAHATSAVMYPNTGASFRRKHSAVTWKMPEFEIKTGSDGKLLVRFSTATSWPRKGKVDAKFEVHTPDAGSRLGISAALPTEESTPKGSDPFADEDSGAHDDTQPSLTWKEVPTTRKLVGGKYVSS